MGVLEFLRFQGLGFFRSFRMLELRVVGVCFEFRVWGSIVKGYTCLFEGFYLDSERGNFKLFGPIY